MTLTGTSAKDKARLMLLLVASMLFITDALASSVPMGIDGYVYDIDNVTRADSTVNISIINMNRSFGVSGRLRSDGGFSAAVYGEMNDTFNVSVWNEQNRTSILVDIDGSIHGQEIILDLIEKPKHDDKPEPPRHKRKKKLKEPIVITGLIEEGGKPVEKIVEYKIITKEKVIEGRTQDAFPGYAEVIYGEEGDEVQLVIENGEEDIVKKATITGNVIRQDADLDPYYWLRNLLTYIGFMLPMMIPVIIIFARLKKSRGGSL
jgi:hypothetical protein